MKTLALILFVSSMAMGQNAQSPFFGNIPGAVADSIDYVYSRYDTLLCQDSVPSWLLPRVWDAKGNIRWIDKRGVEHKRRIYFDGCCAGDFDLEGFKRELYRKKVKR